MMAKDCSPEYFARYKRFISKDLTQFDLVTFFIVSETVLAIFPRTIPVKFD